MFSRIDLDQFISSKLAELRDQLSGGTLRATG
jgi:hypothetical protein